MLREEALDPFQQETHATIVPHGSKHRVKHVPFAGEIDR